MTPTAEDVERLTKQNAMLMRALIRLRAERDQLLAQLAALDPSPKTLPSDAVVEAR